MGNYGSYHGEGEHKEHEKPKNEPGSAATPLLAGLGDAEDVEECGYKGVQESHGLMVPGWIGADVRFLQAGPGKGAWRKNPGACWSIEWAGVGLIVTCCNGRPRLN